MKRGQYVRGAGPCQCPSRDGDRVVGIISIGDLVKAGLHEAEYESRHLEESIQGR